MPTRAERKAARNARRAERKAARNARRAERKARRADKLKVDILPTERSYAAQLTDALGVLLTVPPAWNFLRQHRLWRGLREYGWFIRGLVGVALVVGWQSLDWMQALVNRVQTEGLSVLSSGSESMQGRFFELFLFEDGGKYLILVLTEVLVFHFLRRTIEIKTGLPQRRDWPAFQHAFFRMIGLAGMLFGLEIAGKVMIDVLTNVVGGILWLPPYVDEGLEYLLQFYLLGFALVDNYFETKGLRLGQLPFLTQRMLGATIGLGAVFQLLLLVPLLGPILAATIGGVVACLFFLEEAESGRPYVRVRRGTDAPLTAASYKS